MSLQVVDPIDGTGGIGVDLKTAVGEAEVERNLRDRIGELGRQLDRDRGSA